MRLVIDIAARHQSANTLARRGRNTNVGEPLPSQLWDLEQLQKYNRYVKKTADGC